MAASANVVEAAGQGLLGDFLSEPWNSTLAGGDRTRARVIGEFAETRLGRDRLIGSRWNAVLKEMEGGDDELASAVGHANGDRRSHT